MSVQLTAASPRVSVSMAAADDPYKKLWWAILAGFVLTGLWLCLPIMETPVGSTSVDASKPAVDPNAESSLDSVDNPSGAPGGALDLSMDGAGKRKSKSDEAIASMLYQAPPEAGAAAAGAPLGAASASVSLAQQLKSVGDKKKDESGWGEKAQRGFVQPRLGGGGLSGMGSSSGGSSASAGGSSGMGAFGAGTAKIGFGGARGLKDDGSGDKPMAGGMQALRAAAQTSAAAAASKSNDASKGGASAMFDGSKGQSSAIDAPTGDNGAYAALDAAPTNLKVNDPNLNKKELKAPPSTPSPSSAGGSDMGKQLLMMAATALIGGMIPGAGGQMVMMMGMMMMQQQQAKAEASSTQQQQAAQNRINGMH